MPRRAPRLRSIEMRFRLLTPAFSTNTEPRPSGNSPPRPTADSRSRLGKRGPALVRERARPPGRRFGEEKQVILVRDPRPGPAAPYLSDLAPGERGQPAIRDQTVTYRVKQKAAAITDRVALQTRAPIALEGADIFIRGPLPGRFPALDLLNQVEPAPPFHASHE